MMSGVSSGVPELLFILIGLVFWLVPLAAGIWALVTLLRIRTGQRAMESKLDAIERLLHGGRQPG